MNATFTVGPLSLDTVDPFQGQPGEVTVLIFGVFINMEVIQGISNCALSPHTYTKLYPKLQYAAVKWRKAMRTLWITQISGLLGLLENSGSESA